MYTEGRLIVEFSFDDMMRIRSWHFAIRNHRELVPRSVIAMQVSLRTLRKEILNVAGKPRYYTKLFMILRENRKVMNLFA